MLLKRRYEARRHELAETDLRIAKLESEKNEAALKQQKVELELKALLAQMNPHFIFNCLNSINHYVISNDAITASGYLTKLAKLVRMVLEKSGKSFVPLDEELDFLQVYMDLEAIRFEKPFRYRINICNIDISKVMVPFLMVQPFIENAIWHGLHPNKEVTGKININLHLEQEYLCCEITDNGVGLSKVGEATTFDPLKRESMGIDITRQRLDLIDSFYEMKNKVTFQNLTDEIGNNKGTCVQIKIPILNYLS